MKKGAAAVAVVSDSLTLTCDIVSTLVSSVSLKIKSHFSTTWTEQRIAGPKIVC